MARSENCRDRLLQGTKNATDKSTITRLSCHAAFASTTFGITLLLVATFTARADIRIDRKSYGLSVYITNTITERDAKALQEISIELERGVFNIWLDSKGGDVFSAMQIGRLIRKYEGNTWVAVPSKCYSSCALIFIAGVHRLNAGEIGLHRPYFASAPQSRRSLEKQVPFMLSQIKSYVTEMGITDNFYQQMVNTEPSQMATYGSSDYRTVVPKYDPLYDEVRISYEAREYGITTSEMRQREQDAEKCYELRDTSQASNCVAAINWGLSERVYRERYNKAIAACNYSDDEIKILTAIPKKERRDHPVHIRGETCVRNIMLRQ